MSKIDSLKLNVNKRVSVSTTNTSVADKVQKVNNTIRVSTCAQGILNLSLHEAQWVAKIVSMEMRTIQEQHRNNPLAS